MTESNKHLIPDPIETRDAELLKQFPSLFIRKKPISLQEALEDFIKLWCKECDMLKLTSTNLDILPTLSPLCPKETLDTCPTYQRVLLYIEHTQKGAPHDTSTSNDHLAAIRPSNGNLDA